MGHSSKSLLQHQRNSRPLIGTDSEFSANDGGYLEGVWGGRCFVISTNTVINQNPVPNPRLHDIDDWHMRSEYGP